MKCPVCKKEFDVLWPSQWAYKRGNQFICSWGCIRRYDRKEADRMQGKAILTDKQKRKAIEMALNGESPLQYIKECGAANPTTTWQSVLNWAKKNCDRDVYEELPERFGQQKKDTLPPWKPGTPKPPEEPKVELVYDESIAEEYRKEQEAKRAKDEEMARLEKEIESLPPVKASLPEPDENEIWHVTAIRNKEWGEFYFDEKYQTIDWRHPSGEEVSLPVVDWKRLPDLIPLILRALGVEV